MTLTALEQLKHPNQVISLQISGVRHAGILAPSDVNNVAAVVKVIIGADVSSMPHRYPAGVTSAPEPLIEALARFSARTALLPRTNPVAETAAASSAASPLTNGWKPTPAVEHALAVLSARCCD